jgi:hypothetical protein
VVEQVTVNVALSSSPSGTPDDPVVGTITKTVKIKGHGTSAFGAVTVKSIPAGLSGTENVLFKLSDASGGANLISAGTVAVGAPFSDLDALSATAPARVHLGKKLKTTVAISQLGNIPFANTVPVELFLSADPTLDNGDIDLGQSSGHIALKPGMKGALHLSATIASGVSAGSYFVIAKIDPANTLSDANAANNIVASGKTVSVS